MVQELFILGAPTWSNLIGLNFLNKPKLGLANFPELKKFYISDGKKSFVYSNRKKNNFEIFKRKNLKMIKIIGNFHGTLSYEKQKK